MKNLKEIVRKNIYSLKPYSSARNEFKGEASIFIDANENPYDTPYNRYPDPLQLQVKSRAIPMTERKSFSPFPTAAQAL